ncbi:uncharacterized protein [Chelonus insularis]|nr:uncharacterized protein LOC118071707 isoform X2 [Chelonus insularis]XP_034946930.1 uncharacterized protein LOC118071707 isoform X2 [Chelonus insularis]
MEVDMDENLPRNFQDMKSQPRQPGKNNHNDDDDDSEDDSNDKSDNSSSESSSSGDSESSSSNEDTNNDDDDWANNKYRFYDSDEDTEDDEDDDEDDDADNNIDLKSSSTCQLHSTAKEQLLGAISIALRHHLSFKAILSLLEVLKLILNSNGLPITKNVFWKTLNHGNSSIIEYYYCRLCQRYYGKRIGNKFEKYCACTKYKPESAISFAKHFLEINLSSQLKQLFSIPNMYELLQYRFNRIKKQNDALEDIYDGAEYRRLCSDGNFLSNRNNFSLTFNVGPRRLLNSSDMNAWPIYVEINELPPHMRRQFMLLAGIYVDCKPLNINHFLIPFMTEMKKLYDHGIVWKSSQGVEITSKFIAVICTIDSDTRASILQMNQYDKDNGCINCYDKGHKLSAEKYVYPISQSCGRLRTHNEVVNDMLQAYNIKTTVNGIQKISSLTALPLFDICKNVVVDSMDTVFLGVVKQHFKMLMKTPNAPYYIGKASYRSLIDKTLLNIKLPSCCSRNPRSISKWHLWKPCEWKNWLGYAPACLEGVINVKYTKHLSFLSEAIDILNNDCVTQERLNRADDLLKKYVELFEQYFGIPNLSYNIHLLTHITDNVRNWGPIWSYSRYPFEWWNNKIINVVRNPHKRIDEFTTHFLMYKYFISAAFESSVSTKTTDFIQDIMKTSTIQYEIQNFVTGKSVVRSPLNNEKLLLSKENYQPKLISCYDEIIINGVKFQSQSSDDTNFCNSIIASGMGNYGTIVNIISFQHENRKIFKIFMQEFRHIKYAFNTQYISQVKPTNNIVCVSKIQNITPAIKISTAKNIFIYKLPNCWEID